MIDYQNSINYYCIKLYNSLLKNLKKLELKKNVRHVRKQCLLQV